ncbi:hypothetical protein BUALT_Bualt10G0130500 [Buddleja alternifolia]|uniref:Protein BIG GRAIN 1-like B n=1 Tax=Buddleja alternifolia TaxID=168488 RepID=A0AAV6X5L2_9LAMI|nr:hypothetical protein BUALT_Bualt10G0130500 [Buddleja alternifolia]
MPSFSSSLLDEIYRSIDEKTQDFNEKPVQKQSSFRASKEDDEEIASFRRACLVEKWLENEKKAANQRTHLLQDNDLMFFSSTSSSNSDSSGALSSSDTEFFASSTKPKVSCFSTTRPKPVRTGPARKSKEECNSFGDYDQNNHKNKMDGDDLIKSKSRALKIYANLKKVKQPISPGGRLTTFINSLFNNGNSKKSKNVETNREFRDLKSPNAALSSTCSSASSFSRSCLSKYSPKSREKIRNGVQRTVRFHPVSVIVDEDSRACGHKSIYGEDCDGYGKRPPLYPHALEELKLSKREKNRNVEEGAQNVLKGYNNQRCVDDVSIFRKIRDEDEDEDDDDGMSDSSSDLFELDHLALFGNNRFYEELPVYETTHFETNRTIASGLIR